MTHMVDNNKSESGIENEVLACNTLCPEDAVRALQMLKNAMGGEDVKAAEKKWNPNVKTSNVEAIESVTGAKLDLVAISDCIPLTNVKLIVIPPYCSGSFRASLSDAAYTYPGYSHTFH